VKSRRQAIAIALEEAARPNMRAIAATSAIFGGYRTQEAQGPHGKGARRQIHVGAYRKRESTRAMAAATPGTYREGRKAATAAPAMRDGHTSAGALCKGPEPRR